MKRLNLFLMAMSLCFGAVVFFYARAVARQSHVMVSELERELK